MAIRYFRQTLVMMMLSLGVPNLSISATPQATKGPITEWSSKIPAVVSDSALWRQLVDELYAHKMPYGAVAAAQRMLLFFSDLKTKEAAYQALIRSIDDGYNFPTRAWFLTGDLEPAPDHSDFANSYYFYKGLAAEELGLKKWADEYLRLVDKDTFEKYRFYLALNEYRSGDLDKAVSILTESLSRLKDPRQRALCAKIARTLARIYFEQGKYADSYSVYESFLLRLHAVEPNDWIEAAWNLYYLKRYDQSLGMLYNLESSAAGRKVNLDKYIIRALTYRQLCMTNRSRELISEFDTEFGSVLVGIKTGKKLTQLPELRQIFLPENQSLYELAPGYARLRKEAVGIKSLSRSLKPVALYLYKTELRTLKKQYPLYVEHAVESAANQLVMFSEHLRFIKFDAVKAEIISDSVATASTPAPDLNGARDDFIFRWKQNDEFWRDERISYRAVVSSQCVK